MYAVEWIIYASLFMIVNYADGQTCSGSRCGDCLINDGCVWCKDQGFSSTRCGSLTRIQNTGCKNIVRRKNHSLRILEYKDFSDGGPGMEPVQIRPQRVRIRLVPNSDSRTDPLKLMVYFKLARNFPLDIYFLHDPSKSMEKLITSLTQLKSDIAREISNLTTNFRFGFGTAMDKVIEPFTNTSRARQIYPCGHPLLQCDKPYSFLHRLALTSNLADFIATLNKVNATGNQDIVEGLFDGLMQVMVCGDRIGWRHKARRMVIFATDINFHHAGDGRVAGILEPNDCLCHLDNNGKYKMAEKQDYPSVGQIIQKARENNINLIFVIGGRDNSTVYTIKKEYYDPLTKLLPGEIKGASVLTTDANNILGIIRESYQRLRGTIKLTTSEIPKEIILGIYTDCGTGGRTFDKGNICEGLTFNCWATFKIFMVSNMTTCPIQKSTNFTIFPEGLEDRVHIMLDHECECDCQQEPEAEPNSAKCSGRGTYECGVCHCQEGWSGVECECDQRGTEEEACGTDTGICSNAGKCTCRKCVCFEGYSGERCACNDQTCPRHNGNLCGGPIHGTCSCRRCVCTSVYSGPSCDCMKSVNHCMSQNGTVCSDHGECKCGKCHCDVGFHGKFCDLCHPCTGASCKRNYNCVECVGFSQGQYNETICKEKCHNVEIVQYLQTGVAELNESYMPCVLEDYLRCIIYFNVYETEDGEAVQVKETKRCPPGPINPLIIGLGISGAVCLVGLVLLIIWKLMTVLYDNVEFSLLESKMNNKEREKHRNPAYEGYITIDENPLSDTDTAANAYVNLQNEEHSNGYAGDSPKRNPTEHQNPAYEGYITSNENPPHDTETAANAYEKLRNVEDNTTYIIPIHGKSTEHQNPRYEGYITSNENPPHDIETAANAYEKLRNVEGNTTYLIPIHRKSTEPQNPPYEGYITTIENPPYGMATAANVYEELRNAEDNTGFDDISLNREFTEYQTPHDMETAAIVYEELRNVEDTTGVDYNSINQKIIAIYEEVN